MAGTYRSNKFSFEKYRKEAVHPNEATKTSYHEAAYIITLPTFKK